MAERRQVDVASVRCPDCGSSRFVVHAELDALLTLDVALPGSPHVEAVALRSWPSTTDGVPTAPFTRDEHSDYPDADVVCAGCGRPMMRWDGTEAEYDDDLHLALNEAEWAVECAVESVPVAALPDLAAWTWLDR